MRRYTLLFIDDEEVIRESFLKLVDWDKHQFDVVGVYKNGEEAWGYLTEHDVDIIVTDINMPFMNGITLLENIRRVSPRTRVLLLTGYEYFEYAQKAVELKAFDLLLKPVMTERLLSAVKKAAFDIEKEEAAEEAAGKGMEFSQSYFLNQLLHGRIEKDEIHNRAGELRMPSEPGSYLAMMLGVDAACGKGIPQTELWEVKRSIQEQLQKKKENMETLSETVFQLYFARDISIHISMVFAAERKGVFTEDFIRTLAEQIMDLEKNQGEYRLTLVAGKARQRMEEMPESYKTILHTLENRHILGIGKIIYASDSRLERKAADRIVLPTDTFLQHIRMGMVEEVKADIEKIYNMFRHKEYLSLESAKMVTTELAITAFKGETASKDESVSYLYYLNHIQQLHTLDEMERDITEFAMETARKRKDGGNHKKQAAESALDYLRNHYADEELSLNDVAAFLNISVPYLAVLFKQETGQNFSTHLLEIRMEKAIELLRTTGMTVSEISEHVGYSSSQYFAVCFKKYTGSSPAAFRELK